MHPGMAFETSHAMAIGRMPKKRCEAPEYSPEFGNPRHFSKADLNNVNMLHGCGGEDKVKAIARQIAGLGAPAMTNSLFIDESSADVLDDIDAMDFLRAEFDEAAAILAHIGADIQNGRWCAGKLPGFTDMQPVVPD